MEREETYCDSCKKVFDGHVYNEKLRFKVETGFREMLYGGWVWKRIDLCRECFSGLKIVWEDKCREIEMRVNRKSDHPQEG